METREQTSLNRKRRRKGKDKLHNHEKLQQIDQKSQKKVRKGQT